MDSRAKAADILRRINADIVSKERMVRRLRTEIDALVQERDDQMTLPASPEDHVVIIIAADGTMSAVGPFTEKDAARYAWLEECDPENDGVNFVPTLLEASPIERTTS